VKSITEDADARSLVVSGVMVDTAGADVDLTGHGLPAATFFELAVVGAKIEVEGGFDGEVLIAAQIAQDD